MKQALFRLALLIFLLPLTTLSQEASKPFTVTRTTSFGASSEGGTAGFRSTYAVNSEGQRVEIRHIRDQETGDAIDLRTVVSGRQRWNIEPRTRTIVYSREIYPKRTGLDLLTGLTLEAEVAAMTACDSDAEPSTRMLGYPVHQVRSIRRGATLRGRMLYPNGIGRVARLEVTLWVAPALGCLPLRMEQVTIANDGKEMGRTIHAVEQVIEGEPDARWFEVPPDYEVIRPGQMSRTWRAPGFRP